MLKEEKLLPLQERGKPVIESIHFPTVNYAMNGETVGILTRSNGSIAMDLDAFRVIVQEALEVFDFWTEGVKHD